MRRRREQETRLGQNTHLENRPKFLVPLRVQLLRSLCIIPQVTKQPVPIEPGDVADSPAVPRGPAPYEHLPVPSTPRAHHTPWKKSIGGPQLVDSRRGHRTGEKRATRTMRVIESGVARRSSHRLKAHRRRGNLSLEEILFCKLRRD